MRSMSTYLYCKALGIILCALIWQISHSYNRLDDGHCDVTGHRKMSALSTACAMVTTHEISVMIWSFKGPKLFCVIENLLEIKKSDGLHIMVLSISWILFRTWVELLIHQFIMQVTLSIQLGPMWCVLTAHCAGMPGFNLLTAVIILCFDDQTGCQKGY